MPILAFVLLAIGCSPQEHSPRQPSATSNVHVLSTMTIAALERQRVIRIYLPPSYATTNQRYPVIYMHDGQNLFDDATSYSGEWGVDETLNALAAETGQEWIVVGIDNGGDKRMNELSPWRNDEFGDAEGEEYVAFIVEDLKPMIDATYRTKGDRKHTAIVGSSMGGLISHFTILEYPDGY